MCYFSNKVSTTVQVAPGTHIQLHMLVWYLTLVNLLLTVISISSLQSISGNIPEKKCWCMFLSDEHIK